MRRFLIGTLREDGPIPLPPDAAHHALRVCRLPDGAEIVVFDGAGRQARARLHAGDAAVTLLEAPVAAAPTTPAHLVLALLKGDAMAHALRMATEAGATHIHPVISQRSVALGERRDRWERILESAAQQCGRADRPALSDVAPLRAAQASLPGRLRCYVAAPGAEPAGALGGGAVAVGPEGGWTAAELAAFVDAGWQPVGLGDWVLRADTAAAIATRCVAAR